jgi:hypothetical protein
VRRLLPLLASALVACGGIGLSEPDAGILAIPPSVDASTPAPDASVDAGALALDGGDLADASTSPGEDAGVGAWADAAAPLDGSTPDAGAEDAGGGIVRPPPGGGPPLFLELGTGVAAFTPIVPGTPLQWVAREFRGPQLDLAFRAYNLPSGALFLELSLRRLGDGVMVAQKRVPFAPVPVPAAGYAERLGESLPLLMPQESAGEALVYEVEVYDGRGRTLFFTQVLVRVVKAPCGHEVPGFDEPGCPG